MSVLKFVNGPNDDRQYLDATVDYICSRSKTRCDENIRTSGCYAKHPVRDMTAVKKSYHKTHGKQGEHYVLSLTPDNESTSDEQYMELADKIASYFSQYQCVYALHKDTQFRHLHFVMNSVNYTNGKKFSQCHRQLGRFKNHCNDILDEYGFDIIRTSSTDLCDNTSYTLEQGFDFLEILDDYPEPRKEEVCIDIDPDDDPYENPNYKRGYRFNNDSSAFTDEREVSPMNNLYPTYTYPTTFSTSAVTCTQQQTPQLVSSYDSHTNPQAAPAYPTLELDMSTNYVLKAGPQTTHDQLMAMHSKLQSQMPNNSVPQAKLAMAVMNKMQVSGTPCNLKINAAATITFDLDHPKSPDDTIIDITPDSL